MKFAAGVSEVTMPITLFHSKKVNVRLAFTLLLRNHPDDTMSVIEKRKSVVTIEERRVRSDVTFPLNPIVVSLTDYADVSKAKSKAVNGYPLVCVTVRKLQRINLYLMRYFFKSKSLLSIKNIPQRR